MEEEKTELDLEWERRILCSDGNCIGIIGLDGKCKECGKPYEGELPEPVLPPDAPLPASEAVEEGSETETVSAEEVDLEDTADDASGDVDTEWENRQLCSDGNCIGVIGPDRKCRECGRPFEG